MGKLVNSLILVLAINFSMWLFLGIVPGSALWELIAHPENWANLDLIGLVTNSLLLAGVTGIIIGSFITQKSDFLIFAGLSIVFLSFGFSVTEFYQRLVAFSAFGSDTSAIAMLICAPILLLYFYVILKFWRGND